MLIREPAHVHLAHAAFCCWSKLAAHSQPALQTGLMAHACLPTNYASSQSTFTGFCRNFIVIQIGRFSLIAQTAAPWRRLELPLMSPRCLRKEVALRGLVLVGPTWNCTRPPESTPSADRLLLEAGSNHTRASALSFLFEVSSKRTSKLRFRHPHWSLLSKFRPLFTSARRN